jgi:predicted outer membrane repeat protein
MLSAQSTIQNCKFINNTALLSGGAIYASDCDININNTLIDANKLIDDDYGNGGGIYADYSTTYVGNCTITNNAKNGIYAYDKELTVENTTFVGNGEAIYGVFIDCKVINIDAGNDTLCLNETLYFSIMDGAGKQLVLVNNTINVTNLPSRYDSRQWGWVTPVRNQGEKGSCWAFGTIAALESALLKATGIEYNLSVNNMGNIMIKYSQYGITSEFEGGFDRQGLEYVIGWFGAFSEEYDAFDEVGKISPVITTAGDIHILDVLILGPRMNSTDNDALKRAIIKCGAVTLGIATDGYDGNATFYQNEFGDTDHQIAFVGWDDNYPASNFADTPPGDGAFIIKNSWGTDKGDNGYFYISYYDTSILNESVGYGFLIENTENYIRNYQHDLSGKMDRVENNGSVISYRNSYSSLGDELISAIGTYFDENEGYSFEIYVNGKLVHTQSGTAPFGGYHTVKLTKAIPVALGNIFTVVMNKASVTLLKESRQHYINGSSQYNVNGTWVNASDDDRVCSLKVYTAEDDTKIINNENIAVDYDGGKYFSVKVVTADNRAVGAGASVKFNINGKTSTVQTDINGIAKISIIDVPKKYTMTTTYKGKSVKNTVTVNQVLKATKVTVKKTAKKFTLKATLKINGKLVKGKWITFKFKGKTYKVKTNSKGIAQKTLKKSVIKKLKKGKTYTVKVTYLKDTIKTTVKVK